MAVLVVGQAVERRPGVDDGGKQAGCCHARGKARRGECRVGSNVFLRAGARAVRLAVALAGRHDQGPFGPEGLRPHGRFGPIVRPAAVAWRAAADAPTPFLRHRLQRGDAVLGVGVGRKEIVHALAG